MVFIPSFRNYTDVTRSISNQNYLAVSLTAAALTARVQTNGILLSWYGYPGVTYQTMYSTDLVTWWWHFAPIAGTNGPLQLLVPLSTAPIEFFRVEAVY